MALPNHHAQKDPHRTAVTDDQGRTLSYGDLNDGAWRLARLIRDSGVGEGDHIAFCLENRLEYFQVLFAGRYSGIYYTAISPWLHDEEVAYIVQNCGAKLVIGSAQTRARLAQARAECGDVGRWLNLDGGAPGWEDLSAAMAATPPGPLPNPREGLDMLYSSGTTGRPKGVMHPLPDTPFGTEPEARVGLFDRNRVDGNTIYLNPAPLYHAAPLRWSMAVLCRGGQVVSMGRFDAARALELMGSHRVTHVQFVPTMMSRILKLPEEVRAAFDPTPLISVVHAAAPCPVEVKRQLIEWWGPVVDEYYGGTESNGLTYVDAHEWLDRPGTVGKAIIGKLHILDENGHDLPAGERGRVFFSGRPPFSYHGEPEKTASAFVGDKSTLGDIGYMDADGYLFLTDRDVNLIVCGGINIYPQLTEDTLSLHPAVGDVAVIGYPDEDMGEVVMAVIEPATPGVPADALIDTLRAHCAAQLPTIRQPRHYDVVDQLPRHPNGKLRKQELRAAYRARYAEGLSQVGT
ncbi:MAG: AMP-binding protein [Pseudomonadota bacterium]